MNSPHAIQLVVVAVTVTVTSAVAGCYHAPATLSTQAAQTRWARSLLAAPTKAETPKPTSDCAPLTAALAVQRALQSSAALRAADARTAALALRAEMPFERDPELRISDIRVNEFRAQMGRVELGVRLPFERPGTIDARIHEAVTVAAVAEAEGRDAQRRLAAETAKRHARLVVASVRLALETQTAAFSESRRARLERALELGATTRFALDDAKLDVLDSKARIADAQTDKEVAAAALAELVGGDDSCVSADQSELAGWREAVATGAAPDAAVDQALGSRPSLRAAHARITRAQSRAYRARAERYPWFDFVQVSYQFTNPLVSDTWGAVLGISIPIFKLGGGAVDVAEADALRRTMEAHAEAERIVAEVKRAAALVSSQTRRAKAASAALKTAPMPAGKDPAADERIELLRARLIRDELSTVLAHREAMIALEAAVGNVSPPKL